MTLVIARCVEDEIRILCDSKITDATIRATHIADKLKAVILNPHLCICFAGDVCRAQVAIEDLSREIKANNDFELNEVINCLHKSNVDGLKAATKHRDTTDYIVASMRPTLSLNKIAERIVQRDVKNAWIGSFPAYASYQSYYSDLTETLNVSLLTDEKRWQIVSKMMDAFRLVMQDSDVPEVGNFLMSVTSKPAGGAGFAYLTSAVVDGQGSAAEGGYSYSILTPKVSGIGAVGLYFNQGRCGTLLYPTKHLKATTYPEVSLAEFVMKVSGDFGIELWRFGFENIDT